MTMSTTVKNVMTFNIIFYEMLMSLCKQSFMLEVVYILKYPYR